MRINNNLMAMNTQRQMGITQGSTAKSIEKLSSGLRINRAGDDAAGLAISEKMRSQIRGLDQASRNSQDGISLIQTAEGALNESQAILQRMRELSVQAANDTNTDDDRAEIQKEVNQLSSEINRISETTEFNKTKLLNGEVNTKAAENASVTSADFAGTADVISTATKGNIQGSEITNTDLKISDVDGVALNGAVTYANGAAALAGPAIESTTATSVSDKDVTTAGVTFNASNSTSTGDIDISANGALDLTGANQFSISLDGAAAVEVTLAVATYDMTTATGALSRDAFLTDVNEKLHAANAGEFIDVSATINEDGFLEFSSNKAGSTTEIAITAGTADAVALVVGNVTEVAGKDFTITDTNTESVSVAGDKSFTGAKDTDIVVGVGNNEFTFSYNGGADVTISMDAATYGSSDSFLDALQEKIDADGTLGTAGANIQVSMDANDNVAFTVNDPAATTAGTLALTGGGGLTHITTTGSAADFTESIVEANDTLAINVDGTDHTVQLATASYDLTDATDEAAFLADINAKLLADGANVTASFDAGALKFETGSEGSSSVVTVDLASSGAAINELYTVAFDPATDETAGTSNREMIINYDGESQVITLSENPADVDAFKADLQTQIQALGVQGAVDFSNITVDFSEGNSGELILNSNDVADDASTVLTLSGDKVADIFGAATNAAAEGNTKLKVTVGGIEKELTLTTADYDLTDAGAPGTKKADLLADINTQLDTAFGAGNVVATLGGTSGLELIIENQAEGSGSIVNAVSGNAIEELGLDVSTATAGKDVNNTAEVTIDGTAVTLNLANAEYSGANLAAEMQAQINATAGLEDATVSFADGNFTIESGSTGATGTVVIDDAEIWNTINLSTAEGGTSTAGADKIDQGLNIQVGANANQNMNISVSDMSSKALEVTSDTASATITTEDGNTASFVAIANVSDGVSNDETQFALDLGSSEKATAAISAIDDAISAVSAERSKLGAFQNRLEHTIKNLDTSAENLQAAESRIRDVDMASEMMEFTKNDILKQAAQSMLAQANKAPEGVLQLLR